MQILRTRSIWARSAHEASWLSSMVQLELHGPSRHPAEASPPDYRIYVTMHAGTGVVTLGTETLPYSEGTSFIIEPGVAFGIEVRISSLLSVSICALTRAHT